MKKSISLLILAFILLYNLGAQTMKITKIVGSIGTEFTTPGEIFLDGKSLGKVIPNTRALIEEVSIGKHNLSMKFLNGQTNEIILWVNEGEVTKVDICDTSIKIGCILPISGQVGEYGIQTRDGILLAFEEINKSGGVLGRNLKLLVEDDEANPEMARQAFYNLTSSSFSNIIIGGLTSRSTLAISELSQAKKIIQITPTSQNDTVINAGNFIFRTCYNDSYQGQIIAKFGIEYLKAKKAAIIYDSLNDYSVNLAQNFKSKFESLGGKIVSNEVYSTGDKDFSSQLSTIKSTNPDILFIPDYYFTVALIAEQTRSQGIVIPLLGTDGWDEITNNTSDDITKAYYTNHYASDSDSPAVKIFINSFKYKYGFEPYALAALGYDTAYIVAEAIKKAGTTTDIELIRSSMEKIDFSLVTGRIKFDGKHNPIKSAVVLEIVKVVDGGLTTKYSCTVNP